MKGRGADSHPSVPKVEGFVGGGGEEEVGEGQEADAVDGGGVTAQREAAALAVHVPQLSGFIRGAGGQEVTTGVEGTAPGRLSVTGESQNTTTMREVPETYLKEEQNHHQRSQTLWCHLLSSLVCVHWLQV